MLTITWGDRKIRREAALLEGDFPVELALGTRGGDVIILRFFVAAAPG
jgi:hypothetical protein